MRNQQSIALQQLDKKVKAFKSTVKIAVPEKGWINNIRTSLNMTLEQLGEKLGISKTGAKNLEEREASGSLTLQYMKDVAKALDMQFVYGFVPNDGSFEKMVEAKAQELARRIILRTNQSMVLEDQAIDEKKLKAAIDELAAELKREMPKSLWE